MLEKTTEHTIKDVILAECRDRMQHILASDFIHKVAGTFAARLLLILIGLVTSVIVARILGPEGRGLYAVAVAIGAIGVQFGNMGLHASNTYYIAKDASRLPSIVGNTIAVSVTVGGCGSILAWVVFAVWENIAPVHGLLLVMALLWIPFGLANVLLQNVLLGIQDVRSYNIIDVTTRIFGVFLITLIIILGLVNVEIVFAAGFLSLLASIIWILYRLRPYMSSYPLPSWNMLKENIHYGLKAYAAALFAFLVLRFDLLMINHMLDPEQAGYYSIAASMGDMMYMFPMIVGTILFPTLSALNSDQEKWQRAKTVAISITGVLIVFAIMAMLLAEPIIKFLFGVKFLPAVAPFVWLIPGIVLLSVNTILMNYFASIGMPLITVYSPSIALLCNIIVNMCLIPKMGIVGASISSVVAYGLMLVISIIYILMTDRNGESENEQ